MQSLPTILADGSPSVYHAVPLSVRYDMFCKEQPASMATANWKRATLDALQLAQHVSQGWAMAISLYKDNYRKQENVIATHVLGLDFDKGCMSAEEAAHHPILSTLAAVVLPSSSDTPEHPRTRALCLLDRSVDREDMARLKAVFLGLMGDAGLDSTVFETGRFFFGSRPDPTRVFVSLDNVLHVDDLLAKYAELAQDGTQISRRKRQTGTGTPLDDAEGCLNELLQKREVLLDFEPVSFTGQYAPVLDQLQYVVRLWAVGEVSYPLWFAIWVSAHRASNGDPLVRDYILSQSAIWADYPDEDKAKFELDWESLPERDENEITGATLAWIARRIGWGAHNYYGRLSDADIVINSVELSDGLDWTSIQPGQNVAIKSQTGSGKTKGNVALIKHLQPSNPVIISPFIHLCHSAAKGMCNLGVAAVSYDTKGAETSGAIVVRTPQNTLKKLPNPETLDYVFIEEIHALLQHLTKRKGDGGHMSDDEREGFRAWLVRALKAPTCTVVMVDAGLTDVSVNYLHSIAPITVVHNLGTRRKAPVTRVDEQYAIDHAIETLKAGKKVVVNAPSKRGCERIFNVLEPYASSSVLVTADTKEEGSTREFRSDVEAGAEKTQLVVYNAAMGTGVSIEHTCPDLIIQYADYLTGTAWLQHLNRYRQQGEVLLVIAVRPPRQQRKTYADIKGKYVSTWREEIRAQGLRAREIGSKTEETLAFDRLRVGLEADLAAQAVDVALYYESVLVADGRLYFDEVEIERAHPAMKKALELIRERDKQIMRGWQQVKAIDPKCGVDREVTAEELAKGYLHHRLDQLSYGYFPADVDPMVFAESLLNHAATVRDLEGSMKDETISTRGIEIALSPTKGYTELRAVAAKRTLVQASRTLIQGLFDEITPEVLSANAALYVMQIEGMRKAYDVVVERNRNKYAAVVERCEGNVEDMAVMLLKYVLESVGLELKSRRTQPRGTDGKQVSVYTHYIANAQEAFNVMLWRKRGRTRDYDIEHIVSTFGATKYDAQIVASLSEINHNQDARERLREALAQDNDIFDAISYALPNAVMWV